MKVVIEALITKGFKKHIKFETNMPDAEALTEKHFAAIEKALRAKFRGAEVYLIDAQISKA